MRSRVVRAIPAWARILGPGLITGAADDDPSGIATYSIAGASTGYSMLWAAVLTTPMMAVLDGVCARIGMVTGGGLMRALAGSMPRPFAVALGLMVVLANTFNLGADIAAMGATAHMLIPFPEALWIVAFSLTIIVVEVFFSYRRFAAVLKWLCASLLAYVITAFIVHAPWALIAQSTFVPQISFRGAWLTTFVATLGTTITPYLFVWQSSTSREEKLRRHPDAPQGATLRQMRAVHADVNVGAVYSNLIMFFIIVTCAATIGAHSPATIATAQDAAQALRPLAGDFAYALFALGIIGTGLLAVPVLAGSSAYVLAELLGLHEGLNEKPSRAKGYYAIILFGMVAGTFMAIARVDPIKALFWAAVCNGLAAVPLIYAIIRVAGDSKVLGEWTASRAARIWLWFAFFVMLASGLAMIASWFVPS